MTYLIWDRDGKYPALFDTVLADAGITVVRSGVRVPRMKSIMKRWIHACRHELLDRALIWNHAYLIHALREDDHHHNQHRPHRGIANARPLRPLPESITDPAALTHLNAVDTTDSAGFYMSTSMPPDQRGFDFSAPAAS